MTCQIKIPSSVYAGEGSIRELETVLKKELAESVILLTDRGIEKAGLLEPVREILDAAGVIYHVFKDIKSEPSYQEVDGILEMVNHAEGDMILAVGGGSVMDTAKLCSILKGSGDTVKSLLEHPRQCDKKRKTVMMPTTCGTGSEATANAIVAIPEANSKQGIVDEMMIPDYVILEPQMIAGLPAPLVAATGIDALAHAVECFTSNKATPLSDTYALAGAKLIFGNLEKAYKNPDALEAKSNLMLGAFYGGAAIAGSGTTAVHALSYPLGGKYHIAHGVSNAILLAPVMAFNKDACIDRLAVLCDAVFPEFSYRDAEGKADFMVKKIEELVENINIPTDLGNYGVSMDDLEFLVDAGGKQQRLLANNKKALSREDIRNIYLKVLEREKEK